MKKNIIYLFLATLAPIFALQSCGLEEPVVAPESDGYIEFVARPVGYNNQKVETKAVAANTFENKIENCFFLIFDETSGNRVGFHQLDATTSSTPNIKLSLKGLRAVTACFIANVPISFASNIGSISALESAVLENIAYASDGIIGTPTIDLDSNADTPSVQCIPMFGIQRNIAIESISTSVQISLARLFAKVSVELTMTLNNTVQANSFYKIHSYNVRNLPTKVKLVATQSQNENGELVYAESEWVDDADSFSEDSKTGINHKVYNTQSLDITNAFDKIYAFDIYVPEYFLNPLSVDEAGLGDNYATERYKPLMYDRDNKFPIHITIDGIYTPSISLTTQSQPLSYTVYLGEDDCSSFSMQRNMLYKNSLIIGGITNHKDNQDNLDHRVEISPLNLVDMYGESSNCYLVNQKGTYYLPPYKGAFKSVEEAERNRCSGTTVVVLNKDNDEISITNERYDPTTQCIVFDVGDIKNGNAIIAIKKDENIEWSWHLWLNSSFSIGGYGLLDAGFQTYPNGSKMINRNLGASALDGNGLYYQYGSRNPFIGNGFIEGGINGTRTWYDEETYVKNDGTEGLRYVKTINDPCPPGYRMPGPNEWDASKGTEATTDLLFSYLIDPPVGFSYTGFRDATDGNKIKETTTGTGDIIEATGVSIKDSETDSTVDGPGENTSKIQYRTRTVTLKEYVNIKYTVPTTQKFGGLWTNTSGSYFKYYNYRADWSNFDITKPLDFIAAVECDYREYMYSVQEKREKGLILWGSWKEVSNTKTTISDVTHKGDPSELNNYTDLISLATKQLDVVTLGYQNTKITTGENINNGYQVRCIKE